MYFGFLIIDSMRIMVGDRDFDWLYGVDVQSNDDRVFVALCEKCNRLDNVRNDS